MPAPRQDRLTHMIERYFGIGVEDAGELLAQLDTVGDADRRKSATSIQALRWSNSGGGREIVSQIDQLAQPRRQRRVR